MKKIFSRIVIAVLVIAAALAIIYRLVNTAPSAELASEAQLQEILASAGCMECHSADPKLPFYADFPIAGDLVKKDAADGYRSFDATSMVNALAEGTPVHQIDLARTEKAILDETMPPAKYYLVHWGSSLTSKEKGMALEAIRMHRATHYANSLAAPQFANETIRPVHDSVQVDLRKVVLGELLYHDNRLSADNTVSCATCHSLETAGVDNLQFSEGIAGQFGGVNAPTTFNAYYNFVQFWDGRAATLAAQASGPPVNPVEMGCKSFDEICEKLNADKNFRKIFLEVYPGGITEANITDAIQEFEKTLLTPNSRFDKYLKGDLEAMSANEIRGYELFKKYNCATCHAGENMGGLSFELMGLRADYFADRGTELTIEDNGRFKETALERDRHRFKVPGLRNIELTAPYFHDGTMKTLEEAVEAMAKYESGVTLTDEETSLIVEFMRALTGEYKGKPLANANL